MSVNPGPQMVSWHVIVRKINIPVVYVKNSIINNLMIEYFSTYAANVSSQ